MNLITENNLEFQKIKLQNEMEVNFAKNLGEKDDIIQALKERLADLERENSLQNSKILNFEKESDKANKILKETHQKQVDSLLDEISTLQMRLNFNSKMDELRHLTAKNEQYLNKIEQLEKRVMELDNDLDNAQAKKNKIMSENIGEIQKLRKELNNMILEKDKVDIENREILGDNKELESENRVLEKDLMAVKESNSSFEKLLEEKKRIIADLEEEVAGVKDIHVKEMMSINRDFGQSDERKDERILELTREVNLKTKELERMKELYDERVDGVNVSNLAYQKKVKKVFEENSNLLSKMRIIESSLKNQKMSNLKMIRENEELSTMNIELNSKLKSALKEVEIFRRYEDEGKILTEDAAKNVKVNEKLLQETKRLKIDNIKLKKIIKKMNKKLVEAVSKRVISVANTIKSQTVVYKEGLETQTDKIFDPFQIDKSMNQKKHEMPYEYTTSIPSQNNIFSNPRGFVNNPSQMAPSFGMNTIGGSDSMGMTGTSFRDNSAGKSKKSVSFKLGSDGFKRSLDHPEHPFHRAKEIDGLDRQYVISH